MIMKNLWLFMPFSFPPLFPNLPLPSLWFSFLHKLTSCLARKKSLLLSWNSSTGPSPERENDLCHYSFNIPKAQEQLRMRGRGWWVVWARLDEDIMKDEAKIFLSFSHSLHILCATILSILPDVALPPHFYQLNLCRMWTLSGMPHIHARSFTPDTVLSVDGEEGWVLMEIVCKQHRELY